MLKIFSDLRPFFEDNYRRISVREYAGIRKISPPSASKLLETYLREGLLGREEEHRYKFYVANKDDAGFAALCRAYWLQALKKSGIIDYLERECLASLVVLFGSLAQAEVRHGSDIDLALFSGASKAPDVGHFEKKLGRKIQILMFKKGEDVKNRELMSNVMNGLILSGRW